MQEVFLSFYIFSIFIYNHPVTLLFCIWFASGLHLVCIWFASGLQLHCASSLCTLTSNQIMNIENTADNLIVQTLLDRNIITKRQLADSLLYQSTYGGNIAQILINQENINAKEIYQSFAKQQQYIYIDLESEPPDYTLWQNNHLHDYHHYQMIPWQWQPEHKYDKHGFIIMAVADNPSEHAIIWATEHYGDNIQFILTNPDELNHHLNLHFKAIKSSISISWLRDLRPKLSAATLNYRFFFTIGLVIILSCALIYYYSGYLLFFLWLMMNLLYFSTISLRLWLLWESILGNWARNLWQNNSNKLLLGYHKSYINHLHRENLPIYTILIPLYKEWRIIPRILQSMRDLDYPKAKLDVKLVLEEDDHQTIEYAKQHVSDKFVELVIVPPSEPRTKPKACNYALQQAKGQLVTIYDAEDRPHPGQLLEVVAQYNKHYGENIWQEDSNAYLPTSNTSFNESKQKKLGCVQAKLNYENYHENMLTKLFAIEYAAWFDGMLPALAKYQLPIPLGGTSNHLPTELLKKVGAWDPYNVTEDADLGVRLAALGYFTAVIDSTTLEEAPLTISSWIKQRSRWIKGYMQTWCVHIRSPIKLWRKLGTKSFLLLQLFMGGASLIFLLTPIMWLLTAFWALGIFKVALPNFIDQQVIIIAIINLTLGIFLHIITAWTMIAHNHKISWQRPVWQNMGMAMLCFPFYWWLHSIASVKALWQLFTNPFYWEKTEHGVSELIEK